MKFEASSTTASNKICIVYRKKSLQNLEWREQPTHKNNFVAPIVIQMVYSGLRSYNTYNIIVKIKPKRNHTSPTQITNFTYVSLETFDGILPNSNSVGLKEVYRIIRSLRLRHTLIKLSCFDFIIQNSDYFNKWISSNKSWFPQAITFWTKLSKSVEDNEEETAIKF